MKRRTYLASIATGFTAFGGCTALGKSQDESQPKYYGQENVVYEHDALNLRLRQETVRLGETVETEAFRDRPN